MSSLMRVLGVLSAIFSIQCKSSYHSASLEEGFHSSVGATLKYFTSIINDFYGIEITENSMRSFIESSFSFDCHRYLDSKKSTSRVYKASGTFISTDGRFVTAAHVFDRRAAQSEVCRLNLNRVMPNGQIVSESKDVKIEVISSVKNGYEWDLTEGQVTGAEPSSFLTIADQPPTIDDPLLAFGYPSSGKKGDRIVFNAENMKRSCQQYADSYVKAIKDPVTKTRIYTFEMAVCDYGQEARTREQA